MHVLIVEDEPATALSIAKTVRSFGYEVDVAGNVPDAWRIIAATHPPIVVTDLQMEGETGEDLCRRIRSTVLPSYTYILVLTRLSDREHLINALSAGADEFIGKPFDPEELRVRLLSAERIVNLELRLREANADLQAKNDRLRATSRTDALTQLGNRAAFDEIVDRVHRRAAADRARYGIVMADLDHFKCYNDAFGHQIGDDILRTVAQTIKLTIRATDWAFRYGGEEIALLLDRHDLNGAKAVGERVRGQIEGLRFDAPEADAPFRVTISCGVASYPENAPDGCDWRSVVACADQALYAAKRAGRNRTAVLHNGRADIVGGGTAAEPADESDGRYGSPERMIRYAV